MINQSEQTVSRTEALEIENRWLRHNLWMLAHTVKIQAEANLAGTISAEEGLANSYKITVAISEQTGSI